MTQNIDVHWHHVPKPFVKAVADGKVPLKGRYQVDDNGDPEIKVDLGFREFTQELPPELCEVEAAIEHMDRVGLDVVAASVAPPLMQYLAAAEDGLKISQIMNDSMAEATEPHSNRFRPLANVPLQDPEAAAKELRRAMLELGFAGAQISTQVDGQNLGDKSLRPFWEAVAELDAFIFLHPSPPPLGLREGRINRHDMGNFVGLPIESACALASLMFDGVYEDVGPSQDLLRARRRCRPLHPQSLGARIRRAAGAGQSADEKPVLLPGFVLRGLVDAQPSSVAVPRRHHR